VRGNEEKCKIAKDQNCQETWKIFVIFDIW